MTALATLRAEEHIRYVSVWVPSDSTPGGEHEVQFWGEPGETPRVACSPAESLGSVECPGFAYRKRCKHVLRGTLYLADKGYLVERGGLWVRAGQLRLVPDHGADDFQAWVGR